MGTHKVIQTELPSVNEVGELSPVPCKILDRKLIKKGDNPVVMIQVQWTDGDEEGVTWEKWDKMMKLYPDFIANS